MIAVEQAWANNSPYNLNLGPAGFEFIQHLCRHLHVMINAHEIKLTEYISSTAPTVNLLAQACISPTVYMTLWLEFKALRICLPALADNFRTGVCLACLLIGVATYDTETWVDSNKDRMLCHFWPSHPDVEDMNHSHSCCSAYTYNIYRRKHFSLLFLCLLCCRIDQKCAW